MRVLLKKQLALDLDLDHVITCHLFLPTDLHAGSFPQRHCEGGVPPAVAHRNDAVLKRSTRIIYLFIVLAKLNSKFLGTWSLGMGATILQ